MRTLTYGVLLSFGVVALGCGQGGSEEAGGAGGTVIYEPGPTCIAFCAKVIGECEAFFDLEADCRQSCEDSLAEERAKSEACGDAVEAVFKCAAERDCQGVYDWRDKVPLEGYPCRPEVQTVDLDCPQN